MHVFSAFSKFSEKNIPPPHRNLLNYVFNEMVSIHKRFTHKKWPRLQNAFLSILNYNFAFFFLNLWIIIFFGLFFFCLRLMNWPQFQINWRALAGIWIGSSFLFCRFLSPLTARGRHWAIHNDECEMMRLREELQPKMPIYTIQAYIEQNITVKCALLLWRGWQSRCELKSVN